MIGASWSIQLLAFFVSLGFGLLGGIVALVYFRKARPVERALTDFVATISIIALFLVLIEVGCDGQIVPFAVVAYLLGLTIIPLVTKKIKQQIAKQKSPSEKQL